VAQQPRHRGQVNASAWTPAKITKTVRELCEKQDAKTLTKDKSRPAQWYLSNNFSATNVFFRNYIKRNWNNTFLDAGVAGLVACRTKSIWLAPRVARTGIIGNEWRNKCPCCNQASQPETLAHLFLSCPAWTDERRKYLAPLIAKARNLRRRPALTNNMIVVALLGGYIGSKKLSFGKRWATGKKALYIKVALFLAAIKSRRNALLWSKSVSAAAETAIT
jgi:hypothetical protein